jgi:hypothetical protein
MGFVAGNVYNRKRVVPSLSPINTADMAANRAGMAFWNTFEWKGDRIKFEICSYVNEMWQE